MKRILTTVFLAALVSGCSHPLESELRKSKQDVASVQVFRMNSTNGWAIIASISNPDDIHEIISSVTFGSSTSYTKHPFPYRAVFSKHDGTDIAFTFEKHHGCFMRSGGKQYRMSEKSFKAFEQHMNTNDSNK